jgi:hypothetical protein
MLRVRTYRTMALLLLTTAACSHGPAGSDRPTPGPSTPTAGTGGGATPGTGGAGGGEAGTGGATPGTGGAGGSPVTPPPPADAAPVAQDAASTGGAPPPPSSPPGPTNYGGVGELVLIPLQYTAQPVPPIIAPECPDDPTQGFTEYRDSFVVQRPFDLAAAARFKYDSGIYTFWVQSNDKAHAPNNGTAPRTEARYSDISTGEHIWSADVMFESPSKTCVEQIHNVVGAIAVYLRVQGNRMFNLATGKTILMDYEKKWFNLKVAFDTQTRQVRTYVNNCLKETSTAPKGMPFWYFKHGVYTCDSGTCRSSYKNIHLYQKGSTDKFNTKSPFP